MTTFPKGFSVLLAFFMVVFASNTAGAQRILVGTDPSFPPFEKAGPANKIVGFDIDVMRAIAQVGGFKIEFLETPFDRLFSDLAAGKVDAAISGISILEDRRALVDFSEPYFISSMALLTKAGSSTIRKTSDLAGRKVGTLSGVPPWAKAIKDLENTHRVSAAYFVGLNDGLDALMQGRIAGFIYDGTYVKHVLLRDPQYAGKVVMVEPPLADDKLGIAVRKGNSTLLAKINTGLKKVRESGRQKEIEAKWMR